MAPNLQRTKWCSKVVNGQACTDPKCGYAHFAAELQPSTDKQTLKTSLCIFWSRNPKLCMNGDKCRYVLTAAARVASHAHLAAKLT